MNNLKRLGAAVVLAPVLALSAFAGVMETPPCASPDLGIMQTPPCATQPVPDNSAVPGDTLTPPASSNLEFSFVAEAAMNLLLLF